ncbi:hypothetical protein [Tsuneonella rigui]|uniref:hypothetical protein n=1 Tax=Tsuneonella rigui TaxID=1708790 RepID=UPI000F7E3F97|nr:hypothetical protein [Tsuneonella rigui]
MSYISAAALHRAASSITGAPATAIDAFTLPGDIPDAPGEVSAVDARELAPGTPSEDWRARGLAHPAGRGWEGVARAAAASPSAEKPTFTSLAAELLAEPEEERGAFTRALQVQFLHALAACGAVRRASAGVGVSYRTVYRERRASRTFALAWDAALIAARAVHADVLATRAIDGVEEIVFYRGEEVGRRVRYDSRLLLAHLARLDKLCDDVAAGAIAEDFEGALERFVAGEELVAPPVESSSPGQCDKCDKSNSAAPAEGGDGEGGAQYRDDGPAVADGGPLVWCPFVREMVDPDTAQLNAMDAERPEHVLSPWEMEDVDQEEIECAQVAAYEAGEERWYLALPPEDYEHAAYRIAELAELLRPEPEIGAGRA